MTEPASSRTLVMKRRFNGEFRNVASILAWARFALLVVIVISVEADLDH
jgi:hypothetical protein